jgi:hypothetical protein
MPRTLRVLACLSACLVAVPSAAPAQGVLTPPGASGVDEYSETIPSADGNRTAGNTGAGHTLTPRQRRALERLGPDGAQAAALADANGPAVAGRRRPSADGAGGSNGSPADELSARSDLPDSAGESGFVATVTRALGGDGGGVGLVLPVVLILALMGAAVLALRRRPTA